jgi:hypothetical protein
VSAIDGDSREYTPQQLKEGLDLDDFLASLPRKPNTVEYSEDLTTPLACITPSNRPTAVKIKLSNRANPAAQETTKRLIPAAELPRVLPPPAPPLQSTKRLTPAAQVPRFPASPLQVPKTPVPPRRRYIADPSLRPTVQYTDPIAQVPKNAFRAGYIKENIRLRVELEVANREREARSAFHRAKHLAESQARFREGVAAGYLKGAEASLDALKRCKILQESEKKRERAQHNQRGYEKRLAKKARREEAKAAISKK